MKFRIAWDTIGGILVVIVVVAIFIATIIDDNKKEAVRNECANQCGVYRSKILDNACYCATETGWVKK